jgi:hypothetical protein
MHHAVKETGDGAHTFVGAAYIHGIMKGEWQKDHELGLYPKECVSIR